MRAHHLPRASSERSPSPAGQHPPLRADLGAQDLGLGGGEGGQQPESRWCPPTPARPGSATAGQQQCGGVWGWRWGRGTGSPRTLPRRALLGGGGRGGGQRPCAGETRPAPVAGEQEQLCSPVNNGYGRWSRRRRIPGQGAGACGARGWELRGRPGVRRPAPGLAPSAEGPSVLWREREGARIQAPQWSSVCRQPRGGGARLLARRAHIPLLPSQPSRSLGPGGGGRLGAPGLGSPRSW